ncbi:hypothetical protein A2U01_0091667, partial [Trifolium medium]|nr:hypothetical protein [Trifolium medium]
AQPPKALALDESNARRTLNQLFSPRRGNCRSFPFPSHTLP